MIFKSINEIKKTYFPKLYKREQWNKMTPEEQGKCMAKETIKLIYENIK